MITPEQFNQVFPKATDPDQWVDAFNRIFPEYGIETPEREAAFLAQCGHESGGWSVFTENLNYSAARLKVVFPKYFRNVNVEEYHRKPEKIANRVYANRMGNGTELSGDGWKFRGRGPIQLTGRQNYTLFTKDTFDNWEEVLDNPDLIAQDRDVCLKSALWYWEKHKLNEIADTEDQEAITRAINGGTNGLEERAKLYEQLKQLIQ